MSPPQTRCARGMLSNLSSRHGRFRRHCAEVWKNARLLESCREKTNVSEGASGGDTRFCLALG
jgi:hypothetical protein